MNALNLCRPVIDESIVGVWYVAYKTSADCIGLLRRAPNTFNIRYFVNNYKDEKTDCYDTDGPPGCHAAVRRSAGNGRSCAAHSLNAASAAAM